MSHRCTHRSSTQLQQQGLTQLHRAISQRQLQLVRPVARGVQASVRQVHLKKYLAPACWKQQPYRSRHHRQAVPCLRFLATTAVIVATKVAAQHEHPLHGSTPTACSCNSMSFVWSVLSLACRPIATHYTGSYIAVQNGAISAGSLLQTEWLCSCNTVIPTGPATCEGSVCSHVDLYIFWHAGIQHAIVRILSR